MIDKMIKGSQKGEKLYAKLGKFIKPVANKKFDGLPVLGPYEYSYGTYKGQYKEGLRHGFGKFVSFSFILLIFLQPRNLP